MALLPIPVFLIAESRKIRFAPALFAMIVACDFLGSQALTQGWRSALHIMDAAVLPRECSRFIEIYQDYYWLIMINID